MPSLSTYRILHDYGTTSGKAKINQSDSIIEATWWDDVSAKHGYIYDFYHDSSPLKLIDLDNPKKDKNKIPLDVKYIISSSQTYDKDLVTYHIQLRPSQKCNVPYYDEMFGRYDATFPVGLYIDLPNTKGKYDRWLIVDKANYYDTMVPTYHILPCNKIIQYIYENQKYQIAGVLRSQNS